MQHSVSLFDRMKYDSDGKCVVLFLSCFMVMGETRHYTGISVNDSHLTRRRRSTCASCCTQVQDSLSRIGKDCLAVIDNLCARDGRIVMSNSDERQLLSQVDQVAR